MRFLSVGSGTGGSIKSVPEDFVVAEITGNGTVLDINSRYTPDMLQEKDDPDARFARFVLKKRDWDTIGALTAMAKKMGRGRKSIGYAGTKDKASVSVQLASIFGVSPGQVLGTRIKDIEVMGAWRGNEVEMGSNVGNAFSIRVRNAAHAGYASRIIEELGGRFPNYFDKQRFGYRLNNFRIGRLIIDNRPEEAMMAFLTDTANEDNADARAARERLSAELNFRSALGYFPRHLKYERAVIDYMSRYGNPANSMRKLPRGILLMFVHAVESGIFNAALEKRLERSDMASKVHCAENFYGFPDVGNLAPDAGAGFAVSPLIGYETRPEYLGECEIEVMESMGLAPESFKVRSMPELSLRGAFRSLLAPVKGLSCTEEGAGILLLGFKIPSGTYATVLVNEITKADKTDMGSIVRTDASLP